MSAFRISDLQFQFNPYTRNYFLSMTPDRNDFSRVNHAVRQLTEGNKTICCEIKEYRPPRSLDANAYAWVLLGKLAAATGIPREAVYREIIRELGDNCEALYIASDDLSAFETHWASKGLGWFTERTGTSLRAGNAMLEGIVAYYGSSAFDSAQMSRFIDLIVQECRMADIETRPKEEVMSMLERWDQRAQEN